MPIVSYIAAATYIAFSTSFYAMVHINSHWRPLMTANNPENEVDGLTVSEIEICREMAGEDYSLNITKKSCCRQFFL